VVTHTTTPGADGCSRLTHDTRPVGHPRRHLVASTRLLAMVSLSAGMPPAAGVRDEVDTTLTIPRVGLDVFFVFLQDFSDF